MTTKSRSKPAAELDRPEEPVPAAAVAPPAEPPRRWRAQPWHSHQVLHCLECPFSTLDESRMEEHLRHQHTRRSAAAHTGQE